ncbi:hypothetical protein TNCV_3246291 [Trichonephila clavipes]|nr:hypothetical protein TNCV_3246291 [Trichonephila clavipes]
MPQSFPNGCQSKTRCVHRWWIMVLDQLCICGKIPRLKRGLWNKESMWNKELREKKIWIADYGEGSPEIELLIGADFFGQPFTGRIHKLECGL